MYAGGTDGVVYEISLVGASGTGGEEGGASGLHGQGGALGGGGRAAVAAAALTSSSGLSSSSTSLGFRRMEGHSRAVNSLSLSLDGESMVSGSDDGTACVWDLRSRQVCGRQIYLG